MNTSESAEEIVKISLEGMEVALRIAGSGAKNIAVMIYTIMKDQHQTKGKTRLTNMLKSGKPLKIFTIRAEDLKKFSQEAKKYGVLYCALADKKNQKIDGMVDIMVREEDASKINRISERFNFARVDTGTIERELEKEKQKQNEKEPKEKSNDDKFIDEILSKPQEKQENAQEVQSRTQNLSPSNTNETVEKSQSEISSSIKPLDNKMITSLNGKKSVRQELKEIEQEIKQKDEIQNTKEKSQGGKHYKEEKSEKGKRYKEPKHLENKKKGKIRERSK